MPEITFLPENIKVEIPKGAPLLEGARLAGVYAPTPCGGKGTCGKCIARIISGTVDFNNSKGVNTDGSHVLFCQTTVRDEPVAVEILGSSDSEGKFDMDVDVSQYLPEHREPFVKSIILTVTPPKILDGLSDLDRFKRAFKQIVECQDVRIPLDILAEFPDNIRKSAGEIKILYYMENNLAHVINIYASNDSHKTLGIAVDIGTTTVAVLLTDLESGAVLASSTSYNSQVECGLDVISRINYARKYRMELKERVLNTINGLISQVCLNAEDIACVSIAGNTTMTHLLLGIVPEYIRLAPYTPAVFQLPAYTSGDIGITANKNAPVIFAPAVGSYVGGDITAGALCTTLAGGGDDTILFIDIGTNGEILLGNSEFIFGCACSAGPAFEGGGIKNGVRASVGAIERVVIDPVTGVPEIFTIGNEPPTGICGSGIISLIAELFRNGFIDSAGKFAGKACENIIRNGKNTKYMLCEGVSISESDIENIIRAKGAVFSACQTLLTSVGLSFADLDRVYVAGGFGRFLNLEEARVIGLLPRLPDDKYVFLGNSSLIGAYLALVSDEQRVKEHEIAHAITYMDLSSEPGYMDQYMAALFLPHTDMTLFE